jgi:predicted ATP-dependent serine protease
LSNFVCPDCDSETKWSGLCRDCTIYDDEDNIITAVRRVKLSLAKQKALREKALHVHDENCDHEQPIQISKADFVNARRKKPTNKQRDKFTKILNDAQFSGTIDEAREVLIEANKGDDE